MLEHSCIWVKSSPKNGGSSWMPHRKWLHLSIFIKILIVVSEFSLWVNVLKHFGCVPPLLISLNHNGIWLNLLNKLLSSLGEHRGLISSTNKIDLLSIESLSQMNECALKAVNSKHYIVKKNIFRLTYHLFYRVCFR